MQEVAINEYFKPIDKEAEIIMKMQLEKEEKTVEMMKKMHQQALLEKAEEITNVNQAGAKQHNEDQTSTKTPQEAQMRWLS